LYECLSIDLEVKKEVGLYSMCYLCDNNAESFSPLIFHYFIGVWHWTLLKEACQDLQSSFLNLVVQFMNSPYSLLFKVIKVALITTIIWMTWRMKNHNRF